MKKYFYSHLVETESLVIALERLELTDDEKKHLLTIAESSLHHTVLDAILSELAPHDKILFLEQLATEDHKEIWNFVNSRVDNIEEKIKKTANDLKKELHEDIEKTGKEEGGDSI